MTATDELRRMLNERNVEWWPSDERWGADVITHWYAGLLKWTAFEDEDGLWVNAGVADYNSLTPEQVIAATLGSSNCSNSERISERTSERTETCRRVRGRKSYRAYGGYRIECSACGYGLADKRYHFCPNCGRKVVDE